MNETEKDRLLRLYKLLWEQIKDIQHPWFLSESTSLRDLGKITTNELQSLINDRLDKMNAFETTRQYCIRRIKELENDK